MAIELVSYFMMVLDNSIILTGCRRSKRVWGSGCSSSVLVPETSSVHDACSSLGWPCSGSLRS
jgi:hypothetical protein